MPKVYFVIPCYNEEEVLHETMKRLCGKLEQLIADGKATRDSRMLFVDDGSKDKTWQIIEEKSQENPYIGGVKLSRNKGHQNALLSGLMTALKNGCDCVISLDADLQDDPKEFPRFIEKLNEGYDLVVGWKANRLDSAEKRLPSNNKKESKENQRKKSIENQNIPPPILKPSKEIQQMYSILEEKLQDYSFNYLNISNNKVNLRKRGTVKKN